MIPASYLAWRLSAAVAPNIPESLDPVLSRTIGSLAYAASPRARAAVRANLAVILPALEARPREGLVRRAFVNQVRNYLRTLRLPRLSKEEILRRVAVVGWEHVVAAKARGHGLIFATAHLGPLILVGQAIFARGEAVSVVAEAIEPRQFELINRRLRGAVGASFITQHDVRGMFRLLARGGAIGVLADRAIGGVAVRVPFFGREALLPSGHIELSMRTGAPVVPGFAVRAHGRDRAELLPALELAPGRGDDVVRENVRRWAAVLERYIAAAPDEWAVFEPVWT